MSAAQFTPGPWKIVSYGDGDNLVICEQDDTWRICFMATPGGSPGAMAKIEANARLIAAAPELYEALALFVAEYVELVESGDAGFWDAEKESKVIIARAALAKARGEQ